MGGYKKEKKEPVPNNKVYPPPLKQNIEKAVELTFAGYSQYEIGVELGMSQSRVSALKKEPLWAEHWDKLEKMRESAISQAMIELKSQNAEEYGQEILDWLEKSRYMVAAEISLYSNLMKIATDAAKEAIKNPNKIAAANSIRNVPNLVKAITTLHQNINATVSQQLAIDEVKNMIEATKLASNN